MSNPNNYIDIKNEMDGDFEYNTFKKYLDKKVFQKGNWVYALIRQEKVLIAPTEIYYIGSTNNLINRLSGHLRMIEGAIDAYWCEFREAVIERYKLSIMYKDHNSRGCAYNHERELIRKFAPVTNRQRYGVKL